MSEQPEARPTLAAGGQVGEPFPDRIGIDGGPMAPCRVITMDTSADDPFRAGSLSVPERPAGESASERIERVISEAGLTPGRIEEAVRWPPPDLVFEFTVDVTQLREAFAQMAVAAAGIVESLRPVGDGLARMGGAMRPVAESARASAGLLVDPELFAARDWPAHEQGSTCAHVCGPDPGHVCDARAVTTLRHPLPSGGIRDLPLCGPCAAAEGAEEQAAPEILVSYSQDLTRQEIADRFARLRTAADFQVPTGRVSLVVAGQELDDEHRLVLEAYWRYRGGMAGVVPTTALMNEAVFWWNEQHAGGGDD